MKTRKIIGIGLIVIAIGMVTSAINAKIRVDRACETARNKVLLTASGRQVGDAGSFVIKYPHAHGAAVINGEKLDEKDAEKADVELVHDGGVKFFKFKDGAPIQRVQVGSEDVVVKVKNPFDGNILFKTSVCGCEKMAPTLILIPASIVLGLLMSGIGLSLIFRKGSNKEIQPTCRDTAPPSG